MKVVMNLMAQHSNFTLMQQQQKLTPSLALPKLKQFCAYQERCHSEVKQKLYDYGVFGDDAEEIISKLIEENYLNEERFAMEYASGKFKIKKWGKVKIVYELKGKQVSAYCIKKAMASIDEDAYEKTLAHLAEGKWASLRTEKNHFIKKRKLMDYMRSKGYETDRINDIIKQFSN